MGYEPVMPNWTLNSIFGSSVFPGPVKDGWLVVLDRPVPTPIMLGAFDPTKIEFNNMYRSGETYVRASTRIDRHREEGNVAMGAFEFIWCWTHRHQLSESWKWVPTRCGGRGRGRLIMFDGTEFMTHAGGDRYVLCMNFGSSHTSPSTWEWEWGWFGVGSDTVGYDSGLMRTDPAMDLSRLSILAHLPRTVTVETYLSAARESLHLPAGAGSARRLPERAVPAIRAQAPQGSPRTVSVETYLSAARESLRLPAGAGSARLLPERTSASIDAVSDVDRSSIRRSKR